MSCFVGKWTELLLEIMCAFVFYILSHIRHIGSVTFVL